MKDWPLRKWFGRLATLALITVLVTAALGAGYQRWIVSQDRATYRPPGALIDIGGRTLHLHCTGTGGPTVVLEAGATGFAQTWAWIQPQVADSVRVCSYDRAGLGWSDDSTNGYDGLAVAANLRALLREAGEEGPYVMVGHSLGGPLVRIFAQQYPDEVAAIALIDPSHEDQLKRFPPEMARNFDTFRKTIKLASGLAHFGLLRATNLIGRNAGGLPAPDYGAARMFAGSPRHLRNSWEELAQWDATMNATRANRSLGARPLVVISATDAMTGMTEEIVAINQTMHEELAGLSSSGTHQMLAGTDHYSLLMDEHDSRRVVELILELVEQTRQLQNRG